MLDIIIKIGHVITPIICIWLLCKHIKDKIYIDAGRTLLHAAAEPELFAEYGGLDVRITNKWLKMGKIFNEMVEEVKGRHHKL